VSERPFVAPRTGLEQVVAMEWAEILGMERVSADDDFFALGGHSLLGMRILARLSSTLGRPLPLRLLFETRTVTALAAALAQEMAPASESRETEELLAALEQLSDEEALRLLESNDGNILAS
jgi:hypothetical protein